MAGMPIRSLTNAVVCLVGRLRGVAWPLAQSAPSRPPSNAIFTCPCCDGELMCPRDWDTVDDEHWCVRLRCADCEVWAELVITNAQASFLDCAIDHQQAQIRRAAGRLDAERMAEDAAAFARALRCDLIVAADF